MFLVHSVEDGSLADENGIYRGLLIVSVNGIYHNNLEKLFDTLKNNKTVNIIFKGWSSSDNVLYDYFKVTHKSKEIEFY